MTTTKKTILITGVSRGFGRLAAIRLVRDGWQVIGSIRDAASGDAVRSDVEQAGAGPGALELIQLDVRDTDALHAVVSEAIQRHGGSLDAALCNAGVAIAGCFEDTPADQFRAVIETNLIGLAETTRAVLPALRARGGGRLLLVSSDSGLYGTPALTAYTAAKFAVEGFGEALAYEVGPLGVSVSLIEPGAFATDIWSSTLYDNPQGPYGKFGAMVGATMSAVAGKAPAPEPVIDTIVRALTARRPKLRYPVGVLPDRIRTSFLRSQTGLSKWSPGS
jgi:NAD(P)-dependent dehydrogenase (short-subunit alcohol dehydrogenase family)